MVLLDRRGDQIVLRLVQLVHGLVVLVMMVLRLWLLLMLLLLLLVVVVVMVENGRGMRSSVLNEDVAVQHGTLEVSMMDGIGFECRQVEVNDFIFEHSYGGNGLRLKAGYRLIQLYVAFVNVLLVNGRDITSLDRCRYERVRTWIDGTQRVKTGASD